MKKKLNARSDLQTKTEETIAQTEKEGSSAVPTAADKGKGPVDKATIEENANILIAKGGKSMALRAWEEAVEQFGEALENMYVLWRPSSISPLRSRNS